MGILFTLHSPHILLNFSVINYIIILEALIIHKQPESLMYYVNFLKDYLILVYRVLRNLAALRESKKEKNKVFHPLLFYPKATVNDVIISVLRPIDNP